MRKTRNRILIYFLFLLFCASGCCFGLNDKPGVVLRGDWAVELNRAKAIKTSDKTYEKKAVHKYPCGRFGCMRCALGPNGDEDKEDEDEKDSETCSSNNQNQSPAALTPPQPGMYPVPQLPQPQAYNFMPYNQPAFPGMGAPYMPGPMPPIAQLPPVQVINPTNGQRIVMQPALPGQPGVMMINAISGQPIMVNPNPQFGQPPMQQMPLMPQTQATQQFAAMPQATPNMQGIDPNMFAQAPQMQPNPMMANVMVNPMNNQMVANPMMPNALAGYTPPAPNPDAEKKSNDSDAKKDEKGRAQMPYPKYHSAPTEPVFQRTNGIAKQSEVDEEDRIRNLQLEKVLGTKVPENAKIAPNGINQKLTQSGEAGVKGGAPNSGSPFSLLGGALGMSETANSVRETYPVKVKTTNSRASTTTVPTSVEQQLKVQQLQIEEMKKQLERAEQARLAEQKG
ncbi:MAG: hypothetical protein ACRC2T_06120, partial [Thermoguttaceae bacterium]